MNLILRYIYTTKKKADTDWHHSRPSPCDRQRLIPPVAVTLSTVHIHPHQKSWMFICLYSVSRSPPQVGSSVLRMSPICQHIKIYKSTIYTFSVDKVWPSPQSHFALPRETTLAIYHAELLLWVRWGGKWPEGESCLGWIAENICSKQTITL